jgi:hypothetical protein
MSLWECEAFGYSHAVSGNVQGAQLQLFDLQAIGIPVGLYVLLVHEIIDRTADPRLDPLYEEVAWHNGSKEKCSKYAVRSNNSFGSVSAQASRDCLTIANYEQFNTKNKDHLFCPQCGASICIDFHSEGLPLRYGINVSPNSFGYFLGYDKFPCIVGRELIEWGLLS